MAYPRFPQRDGAASADPERPLYWVGKGDPAVADQRNREIVALGAYAPEGPLTHDAFLAWGLGLWKPTSLRWLLGDREKGPELVEADDCGVITLSRTFDLPRSVSPGQVALGLVELVTGQKSLRSLVHRQNGFSSIPHLFEDLWKRFGGGGPIRVHRFEAEDGVWHESDEARSGGPTAKRLIPGGRSIRRSEDHEKKVGPRQQLFGARVLHGDLGSCQECGAPMIKTERGARCERDHDRSDYTPPDDVAWLHEVDESAQYEGESS